ncbi:hypothetical protein FRX31_003122 [Thalictrum thalictroides]|uniref:Uncharacterized protein n=1 Tax=Thalictrum thalictroides TaxID=46969 RepID=A0A7J6XBW5_THATH|nr:hypothetical protein FRX31_003122 [Thalictrum thalictroides]
MEYMPNGRKSGHKRGREEFSDDEDDPNDFATKRKKGDHGCTGYSIGKKSKNFTLSNLQYEQARMWLLRNSPDNVTWEARYDTYLQQHPSRGHGRRGVTSERLLAYIPWLKLQLENEDMSIFKRLVIGPSFEAISYDSYFQNGFEYTVRELIDKGID